MQHQNRHEIKSDSLQEQTCEGSCAEKRVSRSELKHQSELKRAFSEDGPHKTHIGGQALIEGVMMRGKNCWAVGVREPDGGLFAQEYPLSKKGNRPSWFSWPLIRGCVALVDSLTLGFKALEIAANKAFDDEEELEVENAVDTDLNTNVDVDPGASAGADSRTSADTDSETSAEADPGASVDTDPGIDSGMDLRTSADVDPRSGSEADIATNTDADSDPDTDEGILSKTEMTLAMLLGVVLAVALFILLPAFISNVTVGDYEQNPFVWNIVDGVVRVAIFIFYVWLIGRMSDIKRMFSYHGAEHKTIHCYEHGLELTPENARQFPRLHVRCGTAFLIMVMLIAIVVYTVLPLDGIIASLGISGPAAFVLLIVARIVFLPIIAGLSYEITVKWAGSHPENPLVKVVLWPGMQMQRLTTNEPDDSMLECAIAAMKLVVENEAPISKNLS